MVVRTRVHRVGVRPRYGFAIAARLGVAPTVSIARRTGLVFAARALVVATPVVAASTAGLQVGGGRTTARDTGLELTRGA